VNLEEIAGIAERIARDAGALLMRHFEQLDATEIRSKSADRDLVTAADLASEELIVQALREAFPRDGFHAEESGVENAEAEHVWYVDPLDGTVNFVHALPMFAVSIARVTAGKPDVAIVFLPRLDECFRATLGGGATRNGSPIRVSASTQLLDSVLSTGFPYRRQFLLDNNLENFNRLFLKQRGVRRMGSAASDLAYVACGRLDAFWELHLGPYDVAAGGLLVAEAGGVVDTVVAGGDWIHGCNIVAGPPALVGELRAVLLQGRDSSYPPLGERDEA
jgi:myo-inositol-1(or 4)-monophosphatase